ncbi:uncharacterized protein LOC136087212 [Hydra vulgaris]|uniref:Uncharacterized protein LOC136087212 n=1 Tax=Hydra vulgaris TaxID=6087 RepID=A0ABM4CV33_HYDVU
MEKSRDEEGTLPNNWVEEKLVRWPPKNVKHLYEQRAEPQSNWFKFELVKIKFCSDSFQECENFEYTTSTDIDETLVEKRIKKRKLQTDYIEYSDDSDDHSYPPESNGAVLYLNMNFDFCVYDCNTLVMSIYFLFPFKK